MHRDIKPENILVTKDGILKLADFGTAIQLENDSERRYIIYIFRKSICGTLVYMSPEILENKSYSYKIDSWSIGVLTYELLFGISPFTDINDNLIKKNIIKKQFKYPKFISACAKNFINCLLEIDEDKRMDVNDCIYHPFITIHVEDKNVPKWI